jgi:hypothetical protein
MTLEEQVVIELDDIVGIQVECPECHTRITSAPSNWKPREMDCPNCPKTLWPSGHGDIDRLKRMAEALRLLTAHGPSVRLVLKATELRKGDQ